MITEKQRKVLEKQMLDEFKKKFSPPRDIRKLSSKFITWCKKNKINPKEQTMDGENFKKFIKETKSECQKIMRRAKKMVSFIKFESPMPIGSESAYECFFNDGWNNCIMATIHHGTILKRATKKCGAPYETAMQDGWNAAIEETIKKHPKIIKI